MHVTLEQDRDVIRGGEAQHHGSGGGLNPLDMVEKCEDVIELLAGIDDDQHGM